MFQCWTQPGPVRHGEGAVTRARLGPGADLAARHTLHEYASRADRRESGPAGDSE